MLDIGLVCICFWGKAYLVSIRRGVERARYGSGCSKADFDKWTARQKQPFTWRGHLGSLRASHRDHLSVRDPTLSVSGLSLLDSGPTVLHTGGLRLPAQNVFVPQLWDQGRLAQP